MVAISESRRPARRPHDSKANSESVDALAAVARSYEVDGRLHSRGVAPDVNYDVCLTTPEILIRETKTLSKVHWT